MTYSLLRKHLVRGCVFCVALFVLCVSIHVAPAHAAACATYAQNGSVTDGYYLDNGCTAIINTYSPCRVVTNNTGAQLFVPSYYPGSSSTVGQSEWTSFVGAVPAGVSAASCSCDLPWGGSINPGESVTAYNSCNVACGASCSGANQETRTCTCTSNSSLCVLSGSFQNESCTAQICASCTAPWGGTIASGSSVTAYQSASVACGGSCTSQARTCNNGALSGSYTNQSCSVGACPCTLPWGGSINDGQSTTAYQNASVACGSSCAGQTRICSNGFLSGSYANKTCSVDACPCSLPWGGSINSGQSVTAYAASSVAYGSSCSGQTRSCSNGSLSGSYSYQSCSVQAPASCTLPWGGSLAHGSSVTAYAAATVPYGSSCSGQTRTCNNGSLSGSYTNKTCSVNPPASCGATTHTWSSCSGSVAAKSSGGSETVSNTASGYTGSVTASCSNGSWSYTSPTCTVVSGGGGGGGGCFLGDTYVLMANGTSKHIEDLKVGDLVASPHGTNRVLGMDVHHKKQKIYAFNGGKPFVTGEHVLFTTTGPKVIDPALAKQEAAYYDRLYHTHANTQVLVTLHPGKLKVGDVIKMANGQLLPVSSITWVERKVYKLFNPALDGDHLYYANGLLVHNLKKAPGAE